MRKLLVAFYKSLYNADWIKAKRFFPGEAWTYFSLFIFALAFLTTIPAAIALHPALQDARDAFSKNVPAFTAEFKGGKLSVSNLPQPFIYKDQNFVVAIDTVSTSTAALENAVSTTPNKLIITSASFEVLGEGQSREQSWSTVPDYSFSKQYIIDLLGRFLSPGLYFAGMLAIFVGLYIGFFIAKLYSIVLVTLVVTVESKIFGRNYRFKEILTMSLYGVTLSTIVGLVFAFSGLSYVSFITLLAFMLAIVYTREDEEEDGRVV